MSMETATKIPNPKGEGNNIAKVETLQILKEKDSYKYSVEISQNAKGEPQITIKTHSDDDLDGASEQALEQYRWLLKEVRK